MPTTDLEKAGFVNDAVKSLKANVGNMGMLRG